MIHLSSAPRRAAVVPLLLLATLAGCAQNPMSPAAAESSARLRAAGTPVRLLFVGNSLTYTNDLPGIVAALSRAAGDDPPWETGSVAYGGFALEDHLAQGDAPAAIARGGWDIVCMQQGPSALPESRVNLIEYAGRFAELIRAVGARPAMFGVWTERDRGSGDFYRCIESYRLAAQSVDGLLFPAGLAWQAAWRRDPTLPLYGGDGFHPSRLGSYLAALVIYAEVTDRSPVGLPSTLTVGSLTVSLNPAQAATAQLAAEEVTGTARHPRAIRIGMPAVPPIELPPIMDTP